MKPKALGRKRRACLSQPSFYLCLGGLNAILLAICDTVIRFDVATKQNPNLHTGLRHRQTDRTLGGKAVA